MNERIKELATEAGFMVDQSGSIMVCFTSTGDSEVKKFAELIVKECIDKIETHRIPVGNSPAGEMACDWTYNALKEIRDEIKEHFRIEP